MKQEKERKYYVTMVDRFLSGWGRAEGKLNLLVLECETLEETRIVSLNAKDREEMKNIRIRRLTRKPTAQTKYYYASYHSKKDYPRWYEADRPFNKDKS